MGSYGGATAKGQRSMLAELGITEENMGAPIHSSMDVVLIDYNCDGCPEFIDKYVHEAVGIIAVNRVKFRVFRLPKIGCSRCLSAKRFPLEKCPSHRSGGVFKKSMCEKERMRKPMKSMKKLLALSLVLAATLVLSACGNTAGSPDNGNEIEGTMKPVVWKIESAYGTGDQCMDIQLPMLKKVIEETTGGLVTVEMYEPDTICAPADIPMAVVNGTLQGAISSPNDTCAIVEAAYCETTPPFFFTSKDQQYDCLYNAGWVDFLREAYYEKGIIYGGFAPQGDQAFLSTFSMLSLDDLRGHVVRALASQSDFMKACGASPVTMSGGDIYMGFQLGTIEGTLYGMCDMYGMGWYEVISHCVPCVNAGSPCNFIFNKDAWEALPEQMQADLYQAIQDMYYDLYAESEKLQQVALDACAEHNVVVQDVPDEEVARFTEIGMEMMEGWKEKYPEAAEGFDIILEWEKEHLAEMAAN